MSLGCPARELTQVHRPPRSQIMHAHPFWKTAAHNMHAHTRTLALIVRERIPFAQRVSAGAWGPVRGGRGSARPHWGCPLSASLITRQCAWTLSTKTAWCRQRDRCAPSAALFWCFPRGNFSIWPKKEKKGRIMWCFSLRCFHLPLLAQAFPRIVFAPGGDGIFCHFQTFVFFISVLQEILHSQSKFWTCLFFYVWQGQRTDQKVKRVHFTHVD